VEADVVGRSCRDNLVVEDFDGIRVDLDGILRELEANHYDGVDVEIVADPPGRAVVQAMDRAFRVANREAPGMYGAGPSATLAGGSLRLEYETDADGAADLSAWLTEFARDLRASGLTGMVHATPRAELPRWFSEVSERRVTGFAAFDGAFVDTTVSADVQSPDKPCPPAAADWFERATRWAAGSRSEAFVASGGFTKRLRHQISLHMCAVRFDPDP
jgi:hypothetical protein